MTDDSSNHADGEVSLHRRTVLSAVSGIAVGATLGVGSGSEHTIDQYQDTVSSIQYTPHPTATDVGGTQSLNGTWDFALAENGSPPLASARRFVPDQSGTGNDGTLVDDPPTTTESSGQALDFEGGSSLAVGTASDLDFTTPGFSFQITFKYTEDTVLFSKGDRQYSAGVYDGQLSFWTEGDGDWPTAQGGSLTAGEWHTATFVLGDTEMRIYVDGEEVASTPAPSSVPSASSPLHLAYNSGKDEDGTPTIDGFGVFDTALTSEAVGRSYDSVPDAAVAWFPFDTVSNDTTPDASGNSYEGELVNDPAVVPITQEQALDLVGNGSVAVANAASINFTETGFTLQATVKYGGGGGLVLDRGNSTGGTEQFGLGIYDGSVDFWLQTDGGNWSSISGGPLSTGEWHTITVVVDANDILLYVDGTQQSTVTHGASGLISSDAPLIVGGNDLDVSVRSVKAFDTALSATEISSGLSSIPTSAVLWHDYDDIEDPSIDAWDQADVPGQWAYDGYYVPTGAEDWYPANGQPGWYRRDFEVPSGWDDGQLMLHFGAVYSLARVYVNGQQVGRHLGGYTPFEVDIGDAVDPDGTNTLAVRVSQQSMSDDISWQNVTGGITRDVTLVSVPDVHVADLDVRSALADDGSSATVTVETEVENASTSASQSGTATVALTDPDGGSVATTELAVDALTAGSSTTLSTDLSVADPESWSPETPALYTVEVELNVGGTAETVSEQIGIRDIDIDGEQLRINGEAVTLRGVNWEEVHLAEHGHAVPAEITREDARKLKAANINYVRTAHHPTSEAFLDACDELGIVVEVEAPHMFVGSRRLAPDAYQGLPDMIVQQTVEMVERDKNRASVCLWSIANESIYYDVFGTAGRLVNEIDGTRPTIFNNDDYSAGAAASWDDIFPVRADHYPAFRSDSTIEEHAGIGDPLLFDEYAHAYCYNDEELVADPGLRDEWGRPFERIWEACYASDWVAGAAIWAGGDHLEQTGQYLWGLLDRNRRPRPEYYHVKKVYSPVKITDVSWDGTDATLTVENRHEFVNLAERPFELSGASRDALAVDLAPGETGTATVSVTDDTLGITVRHPEGHAIDEYECTPDAPSADVPTTPAGASISSADGTLSVTTSAYSLQVDQSTGILTLDDADGQSLLVDAPALVVTRTQTESGRDYDTAIEHRIAGETITDASVVEDGAAAEISVEYDIATGTFVLRPLQGGLEVEYDFTMTESVDAREVGIALPAADDLRTLSWHRDSQWSTYPDDHIGRQSGTATAFHGGSRPDNEGLDIQSDQPWYDDTTRHGSNDFRSTKRNVYSATLGDGAGRGVTIRSDGTQHLRTTFESGYVDLLVLDQSLSGTNARNWLNRLPLMDQDPTIAADERLQGSATLQVAGVSAITTPVGDVANPPTDPDGDGRFEDVDGDGAFTLDDVTHLFDNLDDATIQENPEAFAFAGRESPDGVTLADVQALYNQLQD